MDPGLQRSTARTRLLGFALCALGLTAPALADESDDSEDVHPFLSRGFSVDVGVFFPRRDVDLRVNGTVSTENDEFDFDEGTGRRDADEMFAAELAWRFRNRWSVLAQYFDSSYLVRKTLQQDIEWKDIVFNAGSTVAGGSSLEVTRIFFGKHLETDPHHDIGLGLGIHWLNMGAFIEGTAIVNGEPVTGRYSVSTDGPLPNLGFWYRYSMSPRWAFRTRLDLLSASVGEYTGLLVNASAGVNYQLSEHFGVGLSYNFFELDVDIDEENWYGDVDMIFNGVYVSLSGFY